MQFTSTAREDVNGRMIAYGQGVRGVYFSTVRPEDPYPWLEEDGERVAHSGEEEFGPEEGRGSRVYAPRPEYRPEPNPILVALRADCADPSETVAEVAEWYLLDLDDSGNLPAQIDHARKVLTRLTNMNKEY